MGAKLRIDDLSAVTFVKEGVEFGKLLLEASVGEMGSKRTESISQKSHSSVSCQERQSGGPVMRTL